MDKVVFHTQETIYIVHLKLWINIRLLNKFCLIYSSPLPFFTDADGKMNFMYLLYLENLRHNRQNLLYKVTFEVIGSFPEINFLILLLGFLVFLWCHLKMILIHMIFQYWKTRSQNALHTKRLSSLWEFCVPPSLWFISGNNKQFWTVVLRSMELGRFHSD